MKDSRMLRIGVTTLGVLAQEIVSFGEQQHNCGGVSIDRFITCIVGCNNAKANSGVYQLFEAFVRTLAAKSSVAEEDGEAVEACRKICDLMGWGRASCLAPDQT